IAILDSSFNPPTRAHLALAAASPPTSARYDARLLLLSVRNADKHLQPGDASYAQRLQMMRLLAADLSAEDPHANVAVGIIDAPTFVGKASVLQEAIRARVRGTLRLTFLQGMDTLERFLAVRYYGSNDAMHESLARFFSDEGDNAAVVCARRIMQRTLLEGASEYVSAGRISLTDIGDTLQRLSSSEVRDKVRTGDDSWREFVTERVAAYVEEQKLY
ncbi:hypothetical protein K488DRAFT_6636, partial [Vararia minispora EC-137]